MNVVEQLSTKIEMHNNVYTYKTHLYSGLQHPIQRILCTSGKQVEDAKDVAF